VGLGIPLDRKLQPIAPQKALCPPFWETAGSVDEFEAGADGAERGGRTSDRTGAAMRAGVEFLGLRLCEGPNPVLYYSYKKL
jgi:hypothetical protein